jgi:hypothetical protein
VVVYNVLDKLEQGARYRRSPQSRSQKAAFTKGVWKIESTVANFTVIMVTTNL